MKKEKLLAVVLWLIVAYAVALLVYCTLYFVCGKSDGYISAFGSILSAVAGFSACFVALYLYSSWQEQKKYDLNKEYFQKISTSLFDYHQRITKDKSIYSEFYNSFKSNTAIVVVNFSKSDYIPNLEKETELLYLLEFVSEFEKIEAIRADFEIYRLIAAKLIYVNQNIDKIYHPAFEVIYKNYALQSGLRISPGTEYWTTQNLIYAGEMFQVMNKNFRINEMTFTYQELYEEFEAIYKRTYPVLAKLINPY